MFLKISRAEDKIKLIQILQWTFGDRDAFEDDSKHDLLFNLNKVQFIELFENNKSMEITISPKHIVNLRFETDEAYAAFQSKLSAYAKTN